VLAFASLGCGLITGLDRDYRPGDSVVDGPPLPTHRYLVQPNTSDPSTDARCPTLDGEFIFQYFTSPVTPRPVADTSDPATRVIPLGDGEPKEYWLMCSFRFADDVVVQQGRFWLFDFEIVSGGRGWGGAQSPLLLNAGGGNLELTRTGGGVYHEVDDGTHPEDSYSDYDEEETHALGPVTGGKWYDFLVYVLFSDEPNGALDVWLNGGHLVHETNVRTQLTDQLYVKLRQGGLRDGTPTQDNTEIAIITEEACRLGHTLDEALADSPQQVGVYASQPECDPPLGTVASSADPTDPERARSDFVLPSDL
jgi:hypothetical protein